MIRTVFTSPRLRGCSQYPDCQGTRQVVEVNENQGALMNRTDPNDEYKSDPDWFDDDETCPKCGHYPTRYRDCTEIGCDDGFIWLYEDDPLWYGEDDYEVCEVCHGTGIQRWCPACGEDLNQRKWRKKRENEPDER